MATLLQPAVLPDSFRRSRVFGRIYQSQGFERSAEDVVVARLIRSRSDTEEALPAARDRTAAT